MKKFKFTFLVLAVASLFIVSRFYIWKYWPTNYSDVRTDYERYARMWHYGLKPYTHHQYEYPPLTIPILFLPLKYEHWGVNYYHNYRFLVLVTDIAFFSFFALTVNKLFKKEQGKKLAVLGSYIFFTTLAKDFFYEGLDLMFISSFLMSLLLPVWLDSKKLGSKILIWTFFWMSTAIKFLTLPLMIPLFLINYSHWKKDLAAMMIGFFIIWVIPLYIFRSTLLLPFTLGFDRPMKYSSFPSYIVQVIGSQTETETHSSLPPDFAYYGPVSEKVNQVFGVLFPLSLAIFLGWSGRLIIKNKLYSKSEKLLPMLRFTGIYLFTLFFFAKIFSQPFHIWYMAPLALYPVLAKKKLYLLIWLLASIMIINDMTPWFYLPSGKTLNIPNYLWGYLLKFIPMALVYGYFLRPLKLPPTDKHKSK